VMVKRILNTKIAPLLLIVILAVSVCAGCATNSSVNSGAIYETWMSTGDMTQQLTRGSIDGFIAWEPITSDATVGGVGTALAYSHSIWPDHPCCVLVASRASLDKLDGNAVLGMAWAHVKATRFINDPQNYNQTVSSVVASTAVSITTARESLKHITYTDEPSVQDAREVYNELESASYFKTNVTTLGDVSVDQFLNSAVDPAYVHEVKERLAADPNWTPPRSNTTIHLGLLSDDSHKLAAVVALTHDYYASVGLRIDIKYYNNGPALVEGFKSGEIDMGYCGIVPVLLKGINDGIRTTIIAAANDEGSALVVKPQGAVHTLSDLGGKTIAAPGSGTIQDLLLRKVATQQNFSVVAK
jgi:NitT/TauT family transport system substrate-binding protein